MTTEVTDSDEGCEYWFRFDATLRIFGQIDDFDTISACLGVAPSHTHRRGDKRTPAARHCYEHDMWCYTPPVPDDQPLDMHLRALWQVVRHHVAYLQGLKERMTVDVFCGYRSNCGTAGFEVDHTSLIIFTELEIPFSVSVII